MRGIRLCECCEDPTYVRFCSPICLHVYKIMETYNLTKGEMSLLLAAVKTIVRNHKKGLKNE